VAWLLGPGALASVAARRPGPPPGSASFPQGGFHALRRGPFEAFVSCGANGQRGIGGHSHNDKLALELHVGGAVALCDPGSPSYSGDPQLRNAFRGTRAHGTVVVDGLEQAPILQDRLFALPDVAAARLRSFDPGGPAARLAGEHRGFARAGVVHRREIAVSAIGVVVVDRLLGRGAHHVELRWPFASARARLRPPSREEAAALARLARGVRLRLALVVEVPVGRTALVAAFACPAGLAVDVVPSLRSPGYGQLADGSSAVAAGMVSCPALLTTVFALSPGARDTGERMAKGGAGEDAVLRTDG
jgi:hypothetical protein